MIRLDAKGLALIGAAATSIALIVTISLAAIVGELRWSQIAAFVTALILAFTAILSVSLLNARQIRSERAYGVKLILRELKKARVDAAEEFASIRDSVDSARERSVVLEEFQRSSMGALRAESAACRERIGEVIVEQEAVREVMRDVLESYSEEGALRREVSSLNTRMRKIAGTLDVVDSRERKMLNLVRGEMREGKEREEEMRHALATQAGSIANSVVKVEEASTTVRKMHNFLRRDGSIQIVLDRFTAAERRMLAAVETAGLDHADQVAALHAGLATAREANDSEVARIGQNLTSSLKEVRTQFVDGVNNLAFDLEGLNTFVAEAVERRANDDAASREAVVRSTASLEGRLDGVEEVLSSVLATQDSARTAAAPVNGASGLNPGEGRIGPALPSEVARACELAIRAALQAQTGRLERFVKRQSIDVVRQVEALAQLLPRVETDNRRYPALGWWALPADTILFLSDYIERERPKRILEIGSGASTIWIGSFAKRVGAQVVSLEHDAKFAEKSRMMIDAYGLRDVAMVHHASLREMQIDGSAFNWYDLDVVRSLEGPFDILVVDGPPESTGDRARMPALPALEHLLSDDCLVLLDDTHRPAEREILQKWVEDHEGFDLVDGDLMRTGVIRRKR